MLMPIWTLAAVQSCLRWKNFREDDITGRLTRRCCEQRHRAKHHFVLSPFSLLILRVPAVAIAKETSGVHVGSWRTEGARWIRLRLQKSIWWLWRWYLPQRDTMQSNGRVSCEGTSEASTATHLSSSSLGLSLTGNAKDNSSSNKDAALTPMVQKVFCKVFELSLRLHSPISLTHAKTSWRTKSHVLATSNFSSLHAEKTVCVPPLSLHSPPGCHVLSWIGEMWNITHNQKSAIYHANRAWGWTAAWGEMDSQEGDRLEVKPLERLKVFFFFLFPQRVATMKYVVLLTLARTKTCLLLKVIEYEMNQSESAHSFCIARATPPQKVHLGRQCKVSVSSCYHTVITVIVTRSLQMMPSSLE